MITDEPTHATTLEREPGTSARRGRPVRPSSAASGPAPAEQIPRIERIPPLHERPRPRPPRVRTSLLLVGTVLLLSPAALAFCSWWSATPPSAPAWLRHGAAALVVALVATLSWRAGLYRTLISLPFSVALLGTLLVATVLGTVVLQGGAPEEYAARYGALAAPLLWLGIDDLFHAPWFEGLLGLLAVSLLLVGTRRAVWRLSMLGHVLCHLGVVVVLLGGLVGRHWGYRGIIEAHEGQSFAEAWTTERGVPTGERRPLGFALRLDDFEIERYAPEYRLYAYARDGDSFLRERSFGVEDAREWTELGADFAFRIRAAYPDFELESRLREAPAGSGRPALSVRGPASEDAEQHLLAGVSGHDTLEVAEQGLWLRLVERAPDAAELERRASERPERHRIRFHDPASGVDRDLIVRPGERTALGDGRTLQVAEFLPDFVFDMQTRRATTRSAAPENPALRVVLEGGEGGPSESWLFAKLPDYGAAHGSSGEAPDLVYVHEPGRAPLSRELLVVAEDHEAWLFEGGLLRERVTLASEGASLPGWSGASYRLRDCVVEERVPATRSSEWRNPVLELETRHAGHVAIRRVSAAHDDPLWLPDGQRVLVFERKPNDVRAYRSHVEVLVDGRPVREATIEVNAPLSFAGYHVYQTNYREEDPTYSGLQVVRDPGLWLVFAGFVMLSLGIVFVYYVRPHLHHGGAS